jgi:hypothetical protein
MTAMTTGLRAAICAEPGCGAEAIACHLPDGTTEYYCEQHAPQNGYCRSCGEFWGGIDSFEVSHPGLCDACAREFDRNDDDSWEDDEW